MTDQPDARESSPASDELTEAHQTSEEITDRRVDLHKDEMGHSALHQLHDKVEAEADGELPVDGTSGSEG